MGRYLSQQVSGLVWKCDCVVPVSAVVPDYLPWTELGPRSQLSTIVYSEHYRNTGKIRGRGAFFVWSGSIEYKSLNTWATQRHYSARTDLVLGLGNWTIDRNRCVQADAGGAKGGHRPAGGIEGASNDQAKRQGASDPIQVAATGLPPLHIIGCASLLSGVRHMYRISSEYSHRPYHPCSIPSRQCSAASPPRPSRARSAQRNLTKSHIPSSSCSSYTIVRPGLSSATKPSRPEPYCGSQGEAGQAHAGLLDRSTHVGRGA